MSTDDLTALAARTAGALWGEIVRAFQRVRERIIADALAQSVLARNAEAVIEQVPLTDLTNALADLQTKIAPVRSAAWENATPKGLSHPLLRETLGANALRRPESLTAIARADLSRIQGITKETQEAIRAILAKGLENGTHPTTLARQIREQVGLTRQGAASVAKYRAKLEGEGRKPAMVNRMVARKTTQLIADRAKLIATTEVARARGEGQRMQWERMVADGILNPEEWRQEWITAHDERTCPLCFPVDGQRVRIGEPFLTPAGPALNPPLHPRCVLGGTRITASPTIRAVTSREYRGTICVIVTAGGKRLACTPNHPILTPRGFVAASLLNVGDDLVCHRVGEGMAPTDHDDEHVPSAIEQVAEAFRVTRGVTASEVPVAAPDFHGDGGGSEVAVVWADLLLGHGVEPASGEEGAEFPLAGRHMGLIDGASGRDAGLGLDGSDESTRRRVRRGGEGASLFCRHPGHSEAVRLAAASGLDAHLPEPVVDDQSSNAERSGEGQHRLPAEVATRNIGDIEAMPLGTAGATTGVVEACSNRAAGHAEGRSDSLDTLARVEAGRDGRFVQAVPGSADAGAVGNRSHPGFEESAPDGAIADAEHFTDAAHRHALAVEIDHVLRVELSAFVGHVYNLETEGEWFAAEGIITHNCRCLARLVAANFRVGQPTAPARDAILANLGRLGAP